MGARQGLAAVLALGTACDGGCHHDSTGEVRLVLGSGQSDQVTFEPVTALAEYVGLSTGGSELRVTLASYALPCQSFEPPPLGRYLVTVTVTTPPGQALTEGEYSWLAAPATATDGGVEPPTSRALASVRSASGSAALKPGGFVRLVKVELAPFGGVSGMLAFESPGDTAAAATSIRGRFTARLCRFSPGGAR